MPGEKDFAVGAVGAIKDQPGVPAGAIYAGGLPAGSTISKKPHYLIILDSGSTTSKGKNAVQCFVAIDKPDLLQGFVQVKGFYSSESKDDIVANFSELARTVAKEDLVEVLLPWHRIHEIRSLVFNANKPATFTR